jgi:rhodanese-related sulfurtransferase
MARRGIVRQSEEAAMARTAADMVAEARERTENLSVQQAADELQQGRSLVVDLREPGERTEHGAIPGAIAAPRGMLEFWADPSSPYHREEFDPGRRIVLHCASGGRSALAADALKELGYTDVAHLGGGFNEWRDSGMPVEQVNS